MTLLEHLFPIMVELQSSSHKQKKSSHFNYYILLRRLCDFIANVALLQDRTRSGLYSSNSTNYPVIVYQCVKRCVFILSTDIMQIM